MKFLTVGNEQKQPVEIKDGEIIVRRTPLLLSFLSLGIACLVGGYKAAQWQASRPKYDWLEEIARKRH